MAEIRNIFMIEDQASPVLNAIRDAAKEIVPVFEKLPEISSEIIDYTELMGETFEENTEKIAEMTEAIKEKAESIDETADSVERLGKKSKDAMQGMGQAASGIARLLSQVGLLPKEFARTTMAVGQLRRGMGSTLPVMAKFTAMLGPIMLISTAVMAVVNTVMMLRRETEEELLPTFESLISMSDRLSSASERLSCNLSENVTHIAALANAADMIRSAAIEQSINAIFSRETIQEWYGTTIELGGHFVETVVESLFDATKANFEDLSDLTAYQLKEFGETIEEYVLLYDLIRQHGTESQQEFADQLAEVLQMFNRNTNAASEYEAALQRLQIIEERRQGSMRRILTSYRDTYSAAESLRSAHESLTHAIAGTDSEYGSLLEHFNAVMNLAPEYLMMLFDEYGALRDVEDAVYEVTQAQIELLTYRQKNALLDTAVMWDYEGNVLGIHANVVSSLADNYRDLANARMVALAAAVGEGTITQAEFDQINNMMQSLGEMGSRASATARERGTTRQPTIRANGAMLVNDPANWEIRGEIIKLKEDVAKRQFFGGVYQNMPAPHITLDGIQVYAADGMNETHLAETVVSMAVDKVAQCLKQYYRTDLQRSN